jgi:site-specific DNA-methyltransferase (adenine-specific)
MKPYYEHAGITIYHGDCREILPHLPVFDLVLTDPPYVNLSGGYVRDYQGGVGRKSTVTVCVTDPWNAALDWLPSAWERANLGMMVFCAHRSIYEIRQAIPEAQPIALLTWYKRNSAPTGKNVPRYTSEFIWAFNKRPGLKWDEFTETVFDIPNINAGCMATERFTDENECALHPTQKPIALMKRLLCVRPATVLDPFAGSGTTLQAAKQMGASAIGIEIEEKYCEIAAKRLSQEVLQF